MRIELNGWTVTKLVDGRYIAECVDGQSFIADEVCEAVQAIKEVEHA